MNLIHHDLHKHFIFATQSNRHAAQKQDQFQEVQALDWNKEACKTVYLKGLTFPVQLLKKVFKNKEGSTGTL